MLKSAYRLEFVNLNFILLFAFQNISNKKL